MRRLPPFGQFYAMDAPKGYALCGELHRLLPDRLVVGSTHRVDYSHILVKMPEKMVITAVAFYTTPGYCE